MLGPKRMPCLTLMNDVHVTNNTARIFRGYLTAFIREAEKYGWRVDQILKEPWRTREEVVAGW